MRHAPVGRQSQLMRPSARRPAGFQRAPSVLFPGMTQRRFASDSRVAPKPQLACGIAHLAAENEPIDGRQLFDENPRRLPRMRRMTRYDTQKMEISQTNPYVSAALISPAAGALGWEAE
jgi:hypothetical protein